MLSILTGQEGDLETHGTQHLSGEMSVGHANESQSQRTWLVAITRKYRGQLKISRDIASVVDKRTVPEGNGRYLVFFQEVCKLDFA